MKKLVTILFVNVLLAGSLKGQHSPWSLVFDAGAGISYRMLSAGDDGPPNFIESRNDRENPGFSFEVSPALRYRINESMGLKAGISYIRPVYYSEMDRDFTPYDPNDPAIPQGDRLRSYYIFHFLSLPLHFEFRILQTGKKFRKGAFQLLASAGPGLTACLSARTKTVTLPDGHPMGKGAVEGVSTWNLAGEMSLRGISRLNRSLFLEYGIRGKLQLLDNTDSEILKEHLYWGTAFVGMSYAL